MFIFGLDGFEFLLNFIDPFVLQVDDCRDLLDLIKKYLLFFFEFKVFLLKFFDFGIVFVGFLKLLVEVILDFFFLLDQAFQLGAHSLDLNF